MLNWKRRRRRRKKAAIAQVLGCTRAQGRSLTGQAVAGAAAADSTTKTKESSYGRRKYCPRRGGLIYRPPKLKKRREQVMAALLEIRHYHQTGGLLMRKLPFQRLCREIMDKLLSGAQIR
jgi:hypothetical protein